MMPRIPIEKFNLNISRVEYSLGGEYVQSLMRSPNRDEEIRGTLKEGMESLTRDIIEGHYDEAKTKPLLVQRFVRLTCFMWLLSSVCGIEVTTEEFACLERLGTWDGNTYTTDGKPWTSSHG